jgi:serine/threonine-protein kinase
MATVYLGFDTMLKVRRAVKVLSSAHSQSEKIRTRFLQEAQTMARLRHPNIVTVFDVGMEGSMPFIVMELLEGGSFHQHVERAGAFSAPLAAKLMRGMLFGLQEAHNNRVVHRDIKPHNILLSLEGEPKLTDFGIAQVADTDHSMTKTGAILGTLAYMAPEQRIDAKSADHTADIYASGATLYALIKATEPFDLYATEFHKKVFSEVPEECAAIIKKACEFEQADRYPSPEAMAEALTSVADELSKEDWQAFVDMIQTPEEQQGTMAWNPEDESVGDEVSQTFAFPGGSVAEELSSQDSLAQQPVSTESAAPRRSRAPLIGGLLLLLAIGAGAFVFLGEGGDEVDLNPPENTGTPEAQTAADATGPPDALATDAVEPEVPVAEPIEEAPEAIEEAPEAIEPVSPAVAKPVVAPPPPEPEPEPVPEPEVAPAPAPAPAPVALDPVEVKINTMPPSVIFVDGVAKGPTPWMGETMLPGSYSLRMKSNDGREATTTITVRPNQKLSFCWYFDTSGPCPGR